MRCLSKPHLGDRQVALPTDATYLSQIIIEPDVLRVLPEAVFSPLRRGTATGPTAGKSEGERENTCEWKRLEGRACMQSWRTPNRPAGQVTSHRAPRGPGGHLPAACPSEAAPAAALVPPRGMLLCVGTQQCPCLLMFDRNGGCVNTKKGMF